MKLEGLNSRDVGINQKSQEIRLYLQAKKSHRHFLVREFRESVRTGVQEEGPGQMNWR